MAKRFTDTDIWKKQKWFRALSPVHKLIFLYIKDNCDHAGLWKIDAIQVMEDVGIDSVDIKEFIQSCNKDYDAFTGKEIKRDRIRIVHDNLLWITGFVQFQYKNKDSDEVNPHGNFAKGAINVLQANNLLEEAVNKGYLTLTEPLDTLSQTSVRVKGKGKGKGKGNNNKKEKNSKSASKEEVNQIYKAYPRKVAPKKAKQKIEIALRDVKFDKLLRTVQLYAAAVEGKEKRYIPHPATWFNQGRYDDDPSEWIEEKEEKEPVPQYLTNKL